ncbi:MAG: ABC transporter permease [Chloroflexi bacterium]|nr:ABC transporter permease [Chloroflexota bacterium]
MRRRRGIPWLLLVNILVYIFLVIPVVTVVVSSLSASKFPDFPPNGLGLSWYAKALSDRDFMTSFGISIALAALASFIATALGTLFALAIVRYRFPGRDAIHTFVMSPLILPHILIGISLLQLYSMMKLSTSIWTLLLGHVIIITPYIVRLVSASLAGFDRNLELAARNLGATPWQSFWRITLPIILAGVVAGMAFSFILSFDEVTMTVFLTSPGFVTIPVRIFMYLEIGLDTLIMAVGSLMVILAFVMMIFLERFIGLGKVFGIELARR